MGWRSWGAAAAIMVAGCGLGPPQPARPLDPAAQRAAAERLADAFATTCLSASDALAATRALEARGWPRFGVVWNQPDSVFYAAKPSAASPAGLFVIGEGGLRGGPSARITCVGHYGAEGYGPMVAAIERRWGPSRGGPTSLPSSRAWAFTLTNGVLTPAPVGEAIAMTTPGPGETRTYAQVFFNRPLGDVASLVAVQRLAARP